MKWQDLNQQFLISTETIEHIQPDNCAYPLELLRHVSAHEQEQTPVLFLHGIFVGAWCWQHFLPDFAHHGWDAWALSFRGHGNSQANGWFGLNDFVSDAEIAVDYIYRQTGKMPIVIGHSMGGMVLQRLMVSRQLQAAVLLCSIPPQGLAPLAWSNWFLRPMDMMHMAELIQQGNRVSAEQLREGLFEQPINPVVLAQYAAQAVAESPMLWTELAQMSCGGDGHKARPLGAAKHHRIDRHVLPSACALARPRWPWRDVGARLATVCAANQASDAKTDCGVNPNHQKAACKHL